MPDIKFEDDKYGRLKKEAELIKKQFDSSQNYKDQKGILDDAINSVAFYEGKQWIDYKGVKLPVEQVVMNIILNMVESKISSVCSKRYRLEYVIDNDKYSTTKVSRFTEYQNRELKQNKMNRLICKDVILKGTGFKYFYWNEEHIGAMGNVEGAVENSIIDISDIAFSNPNEIDIQKQDYIIIRSRESLDFVKSQCDTVAKEDIEKEITSNSYNSIYKNDVEQDDEEMTYVYMKFFRQDNEVYVVKSTEDIVYKEAYSLNPRSHAKAIKKKKKEENNVKDQELYEEDNVNRQVFSTEPSDYTENEAFMNKYKANLFPIVRYCFYERDNCLYGVSYVAQILPIQKLINKLLMITAYTAQKSAMPTLIVKAGALGSQKIDLSKPNNIITDYSGYGTGETMKFLTNGTFPTSHYELAQSFTSYTKDVYRANDVLNDGREITKGMSGTAIAAMNSLQEMPVAQWQESMVESIEDEGRILEMFYKLYYHNKKFSYELDNTELEDLKNNLLKQNNLLDASQITNYQSDTFNGEDYLDTPFNISVIVSETSKSSDAVTSAYLDTLFLNGVIANLSPQHLKMFGKLVPENYFPKKDEFIRMVEEIENGENAQLKAQVEKLQQLLQQLSTRQMSVEEEYAGKINQYNEQIKKLSTVARYTSQNNKGNNSL